ncbi:MAG TPA: SUF system NifU family Fe-S cluster assembly protein [Candidatus Nanoarchaeia archaeon]|nr:SUF system NifU family Fe-S cluster assembly protein [Candidatus Nanoarchaeia archaeon]
MLEELYQEHIMEHYKNPKNKGIITNADIDYQEVNQLCGDEIHLTLTITNGKIATIKFEGKGCAISQSAASLMTEYLKGKTLTQAKKLAQEDVTKQLGVNVGPGRIKCATLIIKALHRGIYLYEQRRKP